MRVTLLLLALGLAAVAAAPSNPQRIVGGQVVTNISQYPYAVCLLSTSGTVYSQFCGGTILNNRAILTAAHCTISGAIANLRSRVGSIFARSGGVVHTTSRIINHPDYDAETVDNDISIVHIVGTFSFDNNVRPSQIAGGSYNLADNQVVWAIGWGTTFAGGRPSELLRHVQIWTINQTICKNRYAELGRTITDNMLCSGWLDVGGRDQCQGDSGGPLIHNNVIVGVCSWGHQCALARYPGVNARVSRYTSWIQNNR